MTSTQAPVQKTVFVAGGTGYLGRPLLRLLAKRGHRVIALCRAGSARRVPEGVDAVNGNALEAATFVEKVPEGAVFVQMVGVAHPAPWKAAAFEAIDLRAALAGLSVARQRHVSHFVYLSVAQGVPVMQAYQAARAKAEAAIRDSGLPATLLRPWYVLGPGHRWPHLLQPLYWLAERVPAWRAPAQRSGLVTRRQMVAALVQAIESEPAGVRVVEVAEIRCSEV